MAIKSLAIKYRPTTFADVVEQEAIKVILQQQLKTNTVKNSYLFCGGAGTGKTTCARIFANELNNHKGNAIEMDAASNNSVDDARNIIQQAKTKSLESEYKVFILDECVTGDVEILTNEGFKRFDKCDGTEIVAQYNDGNIEFVKPNGWVKNRYSGELIKWSPRNWCSVRMTPNHVQPLFYTKSKSVKEKYIKDIKFAQTNNLITSGRGIGSKQSLSPLDRLAIVCQADATIQAVNRNHTHWSISLSKQRKIDRLLEIFEKGKIIYSEIKPSSGKRRFTFDTPKNITKFLDSYFNLDFDFSGARDFIDEVTFWDGYKTNRYVEYLSTEKSNTDFVCAVAALGGYSVRQRIQKDDREVQYKDVYKVFIYDKTLSNCQHVGKTVSREPYSGWVYCVKVPSHKIVIRSQGFVFVTGNCHSLSNTAWQAMLKLIEEPPAKSIFIFCTTDPERIPKTILSRVQRYDFHRISQTGIVDRLHYILDLEFENKSFQWHWDSLEYIAKLADGHMRDAITMLDKCLSYSDDLSIENVVKALGTSDYDTMIRLSDCLLYSDRKGICHVIHSIYSNGTDLKQFIKQYLAFVLDVCKYGDCKDFKYLQVPETKDIKSTFDRWAMTDYNRFMRLLDVIIKLNSDIKWDTNPKTTIEATLLLACSWE